MSERANQPTEFVRLIVRRVPECTQCKFRYRLRRTLILGLASSRTGLLLTSLLLFFLLTLTVGTVLHWLMHFNRFRRIVAGPGADASSKQVRILGKKELGLEPFENQRQREVFEREVRQDPLGVPIGIELPGGLTYVSTGMFELIIKSIRAFVNGEAQQVAEAVLRLCATGIKRAQVYKPVRLAVQPFAWIYWLWLTLRLDRVFAYLSPILQRASLGFSLVGSASFVTLLITSSLLAPFQLANNVRFGRGYVAHIDSFEIANIKAHAVSS